MVYIVPKKSFRDAGMFSAGANAGLFGQRAKAVHAEVNFSLQCVQTALELNTAGIQNHLVYYAHLGQVLDQFQIRRFDDACKDLRLHPVVVVRTLMDYSTGPKPTKVSGRKGVEDLPVTINGKQLSDQVRIATYFDRFENLLDIAKTIRENKKSLMLDDLNRRLYKPGAKYADKVLPFLD